MKQGGRDHPGDWGAMTTKALGWGFVLAGVVAAGGCATGGAGGAPAAEGGPEANYWVYVGAESADLLHRVRFGPDGAEAERTIQVGRIPTETEGPHGVEISPDGRYLFMSTGHGVPDGQLWKFELGPDTLVGGPIFLGKFPASLDLTPDGLYAFVVNFNLHGDMVPSTISVVYTPDMMEVDQVETCTMPHGARTNRRGSHIYSVCMMDDQLVEVDTRSFQVSRRFHLAAGEEGAIRVEGAVAMGHPGMDHRAGGHEVHRGHGGMHDPVCSPTWAAPSRDDSRVFVVCNRSDEIVEVETEGWTLVRRFPTGRGPYNLAQSPDGRLLVATLKQGNGVQFFDAATGQELGLTPTSTTVVHGVAISPDSRYAFVSVEGVGAEPGKVDVFDLRTFQRVADVAVGQQAAGIAFWRMEGLR